MIRLLILIALFCVILPESVSESKDDILNWCLDSRHHKTRPGPEGELFSQCTPWINRSCCTYNTTKNLHDGRLYGFDYNHCGSLSEACRRHFNQDHCFYECSPNIGPWVVEVQQKIRKERYYQVPLCRSDCEAWFNACHDDLTCTDNWNRNFIWERGRNKCMPGTECRSFKAVFRNATNFCQKVWDDSWMVVKDSEACMRLWFDSSQGNPNDNVARLKVKQMMQYTVSGQPAVASLAYIHFILLLSYTFLVSAACYQLIHQL